MFYPIARGWRCDDIVENMHSTARIKDIMQWIASMRN